MNQVSSDPGGTCFSSTTHPVVQAPLPQSTGGARYAAEVLNPYAVRLRLKAHCYTGSITRLVSTSSNALAAGPAATMITRRRVVQSSSSHDQCVDARQRYTTTQDARGAVVCAHLCGEFITVLNAHHGTVCVDAVGRFRVAGPLWDTPAYLGHRRHTTSCSDLTSCFHVLSFSPSCPHNLPCWHACRLRRMTSSRLRHCQTFRPSIRN